DHAQDLVAEGVTVGVVEFPETVEVEAHQRDGMTLQVAAQQALELLLEGASIQRPGERIARGGPFERLAAQPFGSLVADRPEQAARAVQGVEAADLDAVEARRRAFEQDIERHAAMAAHAG